MARNRRKTTSEAMQGEPGKKTVWILGTGFSRSLGGPLLEDLLSTTGLAIVDGVYRPLAGVDTVRLMIRKLQERRLHNNFAPPWRDAEEFIDQLDALEDDRSPDWGRFTGLFGEMLEGRHLANGGLASFRNEVRKLVAAQCCAFLEQSNVTEERWTPYCDWGAGLGETDAIITFNYDRVIETLRENEARTEDEALTRTLAALRTKFYIVPPNGVVGGDAPSSSVHVFKFHGSVDWGRDGDQFPPTKHVQIMGNKSYAVERPDLAMMATPGPSKSFAVDELDGIWSAGLCHLREADAIVFVGYRFPPTDAEARKKLLSAIEGNNKGAPRHHLKVHIVLGPKLSDDVERLHGLIEAVLLRAKRTQGSPVGRGGRTFEIHAHRMFAEDFFTVWSQTLLHGVGVQA